MNYKKIYEQLIESRKLLNRKRNDGNYYEKHHILPKSLGGADYAENLVFLTPKEHFIAHLLLTKMYTGEAKTKMYYVLWRLYYSTNKEYKKIISAKQYDSIKKELSIDWSIKRKGVKKSEETKKRMSENGRGIEPWNKNKIEIKEKCPHCNKEVAYNGRGYHFDNCSKLTGIKRIGYSKGIQKKKIKCPHCIMEGAANVMFRFHFDNCKQKLIGNYL